MFKRCKVVMLSTNEKANPVGSIINIIKPKNNESIGLSINHNYLNTKSDDYYKLIDLYFTSDDEIKKNDWYIVELFKIDGTSDGLHIEQANYIEDIWINKGVASPRHKAKCKKIIATTDSSLKLHTVEEYPLGASMDVYKNLPQPSQSFIQKYIDEYNKGNQIVDVLVEYLRGSDGYYDENNNWHWKILGLKVNPKDNTITIRKVKDSWKRNEIIEVFNKMYATDIIDADVKKTDFDKWIEDNL